MRIFSLAFLVVWLMSGMMNASAAFTIALDSPMVSVTPGNTVIFTGTLTNGDATKVFLNDVQCPVPSAFTLQTNTFFANVPGILLPGESYTGPIFAVSVSDNAATGDYPCTLTLHGGADILAAGSLATANFTVTVLLPVVTVAATTPDASEFGPVSGAFTVTRTGGTSIPLSVAFSVGGTAVNGSAYSTIPPSVAIPTGASSANISVDPIPNGIAEGNRAVELSLAGSAAYGIGASPFATVTIHDKPADEWRYQKFGAAANTAPAGDTASWAQDGVMNLIKYGLMIDPTFSNVAELPQPTIVDGYLTISFVPNPSATDLLYIVEGSDDLASWSTTDVERLTLQSPLPPTRQAFRYRRDSGATQRGFLRLKIVRSP